MANRTLSGYLVTVVTIAWAAGQALASLTNDEWTDLSDEVDNTTNKYRLADFYIELGSAAYTGADSTIELYIVISVDGTNYPTWTGNVTTAQQHNEEFFVDDVTTTGTTAAQKLVIRDVPLPNGKWKAAFRNRTNASLPASANTAYWRPHSDAI